MGRKSLARSLSIWTNGERVGTWRVSAQGEDELRYDPAWREAEGARPLSLSLPLFAAAHKGTVVRNYFDNLLPDSQAIRMRIGQRFATPSLDTFDLLRAIGRDCVGAVQLLDEDEQPPGVDRIEGVPLDEGQVASLLLQTVGNAGLGAGQEGELRISLAGAQEKTALLWLEGQWLRPVGATPTSHILKLPLGLVGHRRADFSTSVENEWLCLNILQAYGIAVPRAALLRFGEQKVLGVERFDRKMHSSGRWLMRLPQEDFCQALGFPAHLKYEADGGPGLLDLARLLRQSVRSREDLATLLKVQLLFWMLGAPDGHAKNFSIHLLAQSRFALTPIYDVMSIWPAEGDGPNQFSRHDVKLAMAVIGKNRHYRLKDVQRRHFNAMAVKFQLGPDVEPMIEQVLRETPGAIERVAARLPQDFPAIVSDRILEGLARSAKALADMHPA